MTQVNQKLLRLVTNPRAPHPENNQGKSVILGTVSTSDLILVRWDRY